MKIRFCADCARQTTPFGAGKDSANDCAVLVAVGRSAQEPTEVTQRRLNVAPERGRNPPPKVGGMSIGVCSSFCRGCFFDTFQIRYGLLPCCPKGSPNRKGEPCSFPFYEDATRLVNNPQLKSKVFCRLTNTSKHV
jgi:hypothetical protein